tara:strand:- start:5760 stop:7439 length:1680 start_codon:yes stop_codon:yes gene_type:complete
MGYVLKSNAKNFVNIETSDLDSISSDKVTLLHKGITSDQATKFLHSYKEGALKLQLNKSGEELDNFFLAIVDEASGLIEVYNDFFGNNQIFFAIEDRNLVISDSVFNFNSEKHRVKKSSVYEVVVFQGVQPPETIFEEVYTVPCGSYLKTNGVDYEIIEFWDIKSLLNSKEASYEKLEKEGREVLVETIKKTVGERPVTALSGGIDSGGLLGMVTDEAGKKPATVSIGGRGPETLDLESARKTVAFRGSEHSEIYPKYQDLSSMWEYTKGLSQPIHSSALFSFDLIMRYAREKGYDSVVYGFGAEMLLGNLRISRVAKKVAYEKYIPNFILRPLYRTFSGLFFKSETRQLFLSRGKDWVARFMVVRGAHYAWQRKYFVESSERFWEDIHKKVSSNFDSEIDLYDALVILYLKSWVNYLQYRDVSAVSREIKPIMPFDSYRSAKVFFSVPTVHRMKNNWNKQLIRDIMRPYVADHLYTNPVRSLIVPYAEWFVPRREKIISYLEKSEIVGELFDYGMMKKRVHEEPEPGYFLMSLLGVAVWYDTNFKPERESDFRKIFVE